MPNDPLPTSLPPTVTHIPGVNVQPIITPKAEPNEADRQQARNILEILCTQPLENRVETVAERIADHVSQMRPGARTDQTLPDGREIVYFIDEDDAGFGFLAHDRRAAHQWLDAFLDNLDESEVSRVDFKREHMTKAQIEAMPEI